MTKRKVRDRLVSGEPKPLNLWTWAELFLQSRYGVRADTGETKNLKQPAELYSGRF